MTCEYKGPLREVCGRAVRACVRHGGWPLGEGSVGRSQSPGGLGGLLDDPLGGTGRVGSDQQLFPVCANDKEPFRYTFIDSFNVPTHTSEYGH